MSDKLPIGTVALLRNEIVTVVAHDNDRLDLCLVTTSNGFEWTEAYVKMDGERFNYEVTGAKVEHVGFNQLVPLNFSNLLHQYLTKDEFEHRDLLVKFVQDMT